MTDKPLQRNCSPIQPYEKLHGTAEGWINAGDKVYEVGHERYAATGTTYVGRSLVGAVRGQPVIIMTKGRIEFDDGTIVDVP